MDETQRRDYLCNLRVRICILEASLHQLVVIAPFETPFVLRSYCTTVSFKI